jgi:lipid-binding SYLF domain-containing protein
LIEVKIMNLSFIVMKRRIFRLGVFVTCLLVVLSVFSATYSFSATANQIEANVNATLDRFYREVRGAKEFAKAARGMLVLPGVFKAGFGFGVEYGEGALKINGETVDYYALAGGSAGFQIGAQKKDIIIAFMTEEALSRFRKSSGWEAGVDANIAFVDVGGGKRFDTNTMKDPIVAFVFGARGLMADLSLKGAKFTKLRR